MNTPEDDPASVADSRDLTLGPLRLGGRDSGMPSGAGIINAVLGSTDHNLAAVTGAFGAIGRAS